VSLTITMDEFPQDIGFELQCGGDASLLLWDFPIGTFTKQFTTVTKSACITECCTLRILDATGDFLSQATAPLEVRVGGMLLDERSWDDTNSFSELAYSLGSYCGDSNSNQEV